MGFKINSYLNKRGQVTIFIIIALILVVIIALIFIIARPAPVKINAENAPHSTIETCTRKAVVEALKRIDENGGDINTGFSVMYNNINRSYLCYTSQYYDRCINQQPKLIEHIESEITSYIQPKIADCFDSLKTELDKRYNVEMGDMSVKTKLSPNEVLIEINRKFKMSNGEENREFDNFNVVLVHPIYNLAKVAAEITNQEAQYCTFDTEGYMIIYPKFDITRFKTGESDTIYTITDRKTGVDFNFAIRSCALPPGF